MAPQSTPAPARVSSWLLWILLAGSVAPGDERNHTIIPNPEAQLVEILLANSNPDAKPWVTPVDVRISFELSRIGRFEEKSQTLTTFGWLNLAWYDPHMSWVPEEHDNITKLVVDTKNVWMPEIVVLNSVKEGRDLSRESKFRVSVYNGLMIWSPGFRLDTNCGVDLTLFPFDEQVCPITMLAWSFFENSVNITPVSKRIDLKYYEINGEWEVKDTFGVHFRTASNSESASVGVSYYLYLRRRPASHLLNIITPTVIMSLMSVLVFALPVNSGEKISLGISVLLSFSVLMLMISEIMPKTGLMIPFVALYMAFNMALTGFSLTATVVVINIHHHSPHRKVPAVVRKIFLHGLGRLLCMPFAYKSRENSARFAKPTESGNSQPPISTERESTGDSSANPDLRGLDFGKEATEAEEVNEWHNLASVIDRFLFLFFLILVLGATGYLIWLLAHFDKPFTFEDPGQDDY